MKPFIIRFANRKFLLRQQKKNISNNILYTSVKKNLNSVATRRSSRKSFWKSLDGSVFHAMVSVIVVKIQFSSPRGVFLSLSLPAMLSTMSGSICPMEKGFYNNSQSMNTFIACFYSIYLEYEPSDCNGDWSSQTGSEDVRWI